MHENMKDSLERHFKIYVFQLLIVVILGVHTVCLLKCSDLITLLQEELLLTFDEIERLARLFISLGVNKIRLTGGEPLLRKDLPMLIARLAKLEGLKDIGLTTNGIHLAKQAKALKEAGLKRVNISLDAIEDYVFKKLMDEM